MGLAMSDLDHQQGGTGATVATGWSQELLDKLDVPIIQGIVSTGARSEWEESSLGLGPIDTAMNVAFPEFDGRIITVPVSFKEETGSEAGALSAGRMQRYVAQPDRMDYLARLASRHAVLRRKANAEKRVAIILSNYPTKDARIGNAVGLDTPASAINLLHALKRAGYTVEDIPADGDELVQSIIARCSNDTDTLTEEQLRLAAGHVERRDYARWYAGFPETVRDELRESWGEPPGPRVPHRRPSCHRRCAHGQRFRRPPATARLWRKPHLGLPQPRPDAHASLRRLLPLDPRRVPGRRHDPHRQARHAGNGCRARAWAYLKPATPRWRWTTFLSSTPSSSTTPAREPRPSVAPTPPSSTTSSRP